MRFWHMQRQDSQHPTACLQTLPHQGAAVAQNAPGMRGLKDKVCCRDQRLYRQAVSPTVSAPEPLTPESKLRFADGVVDARRDRIIAVQEDHSGSGEAVNTIAAICEHALVRHVRLLSISSMGEGCGTC